jgi:hypothetical protein
LFLPELDMAGARLSGDPHRFCDEEVSALLVIRTDAPVIEVRHGHKEISEHHAFHVDQRENPANRSPVSLAQQIMTFVGKAFFGDGTPSVIVVNRCPFRTSDELFNRAGIPLAAGSYDHKLFKIKIVTIRNLPARSDISTDP